MPENKGGARTQPVYGAVPVDAIPDDVTMPRTGPRPDPKLLGALQDCIANPGVPHELGTYASENGAKNTHKKFEDGIYSLPEGDWIIEDRRIEALDGSTDEDGRPKRWSKLYGIYEGPVNAEAKSA